MKDHDLQPTVQLETVDVFLYARADKSQEEANREVREALFAAGRIDWEFTDGTMKVGDWWALVVRFFSVTDRRRFLDQLAADVPQAFSPAD